MPDLIHRQFHRAAAVFAFSLVLPGCASTIGACDPSSPDFFNNTRCLASGAYGERQKGLEATLHREQQTNEAFRAVLTALEAEQSQVRGTLRTREADYARLDTAWRRLKQDLNAQTRTHRTLQSQVAAIDRSLQARRQTDAGADLAARRATRDDLKRQVSLLESELAAGSD